MSPGETFYKNLERTSPSEAAWIDNVAWHLVALNFTRDEAQNELAEWTLRQAYHMHKASGIPEAMAFSMAAHRAQAIYWRAERFGAFTSCGGSA